MSTIAPDNASNALTRSQRQAVDARGNVLVMAGAGTGKTKTLVARCLDCLERDGAFSKPNFCITLCPTNTTFVPFKPVRSRMAINSACLSASGPRATSRSCGRSLAGWSFKRNPSDMVIYD